MTDALVRVLDALDDAPPALEVAERLADAADMSVADAQSVVYDALDDGVLVEEGEGFGGVRLADTEPAETPEPAETSPEEPESSDANPGGETGEPAEDDGDMPADGVAAPSGREFYPDTLANRDWWINWVLAYRYDDDERGGKPTKQPVAPYDRSPPDAAPVSWNFDLPEDEHPSTDLETVRPWKGAKIGFDLRAPDRVASDVVDTGIILPRGQTERDDNRRNVLLIDWDDVRDPETGEIHPVVAEALRESNGFAEVSQSGKGIHQFVFGEVPGSQRVFIRHIDEEPFVGDDLPAVEMYQSGRVCAMTGRHVAGSGEDVVEGQDLVDRLCWKFGTADNAGPGTPTDPFADERDGGARDETPDHETVAQAVDAAAAFDDDDPSDWEYPDEWSLQYAAIIRARGRAEDLSGVPNWQINGYAAAAGYADGLDKEAVVSHLSDVCDDDDLADEVDQMWRKAENGDHKPPSHETLAQRGMLPERFAEGDTDTDTDTDTEDDEEYRRDPREIAATVDPRRAWDAAGRVEPEEVEGLDAFACPDCGEGVDVVRAVAIAEGLVDSCEAPLDDAYVEAFALARDEYEAPLPRYLTTADAVAEFDAVLDLISEVTFDDLDADALRSAVTAEGDAVGGDAVQALNPAWRESESEASVLVFPSGTVWDADTERVLDALRFVALDAGMIDAPGDALEGETFVDAYALARGEYGAPLPRWEPAVDADHAVTPQLPPSEDLVDDPDAVAVDTDALDDARGRVETLVREAGADADTPTVITAPPATGKTTATVKHAAGAVDGRDATPTAYLAPRKELQQQAVEKADRWGASSMILPVFAEARVEGEVLDRAVAHIREHGKGRLRDMFGVHADVVGEDEDVFVEPDEDEDTVDLDRETCPTAEGDHGAAWGLVVHAARALGYTPRQIHKSAKGLFGTDLPCSDGGECPYSAAWDRASDPDAPLDLLVGSYAHAHVQSVRTYAERGAGSGDVRRRPRRVVLDEYPGEAFSREFGEDAFDHATWLARSLRDGVEDRRDMFEHDWTGDEWASAWFAGEADEVDAVAAAARELERERARLDAIANAEEIRDEVDADLLRDLGVEAALADLTAGEDARRVLGDLTSAVEAANPEHGAYGIIRWVESAVVDELRGRPATGEIDTAALPVGGDLAALLDEAREAVAEGADYARAVVDAAERALRGGEDGVEALATWADDGYAHPDAHHFLQAVAAPADAVDRVATDGFAFDPDATDGTRLDRVQTGERATTLLDRNGHGAILHTPPSRTSGSGDPAPLIGLDATGRAELWGVALGEDAETRGLFDTPADRARFLRDALGLQVVQCADRPRPYEGSPDGKDLTGDVALLEAIEDGFAGVQAARERGGEPTPVGSPAVITTRTVRHELEDDEAAADVTSRWENYGNLTGANDLGEHRLAAILGSQHYGDRAVERLAALAGEEADTSRGGGRGAALDYGSDIANAYLGHMREDQVVQAALRFARGGSGATVFARTSALPDDLPVVGRGQVVETYSETAREIARAWRRLDGEFTRADVEDAVDVSRRQVRRVLAELADAGYLRRVREGEGRATVYDGTATPGAGEVDLPDAQPADPGHDASNEYYTWNVRVRAVDAPRTAPSSGIAPGHDAPPAPTEGSAAAGPPG